MEPLGRSETVCISSPSEMESTVPQPAYKLNSDLATAQKWDLKDCMLKVNTATSVCSHATTQELPTDSQKILHYGIAAKFNTIHFS
jgi:hypothetical protein